MGSYNLRKVQFGAEATKGTAVSAGRIMVGLDGQIADMSELQHNSASYYSGYMAGAPGVAPVFVSDIFELSLEGDFTHHNSPYLLNAGWKAASATTGVGSATWTFNTLQASANDKKTFTIQTGDDTEQLKGAYAFATDWEIAGKANEVISYKGNFVGRSVTSGVGGFDSATALAGIPMPFNLFKCYYDATSSSFGTTVLSATLREFSLSVNPGFHQKQFADGVLYPTSDGQDRPEVTLNVVLEYNTNAVNIRADWKAKTPKLIRLLSASASSVNPCFYADIAGYWESVDTIDEDEGNTTVAATFRATPVSTATSGYVTFTELNDNTAGL